MLYGEWVVVVVDTFYRDCEARIGIRELVVFGYVSTIYMFECPNSIPGQAPPTCLPHDVPGCHSRLSLFSPVSIHPPTSRPADRSTGEETGRHRKVTEARRRHGGEA